MTAEQNPLTHSVVGVTSLLLFDEPQPAASREMDRTRQENEAATAHGRESIQPSCEAREPTAQPVGAEHVRQHTLL